MKDIKSLSQQLASWDLILQSEKFNSIDCSIFKVTANELIKDIEYVKDYIQSYIEERTN